MLPLDQTVFQFGLYLRLLSPLFLAWVAYVVMRSPTQERPNRLLAAFLATVSLGFLFEFLWVFADPMGLGLSATFRTLQNLAGLIDPPVLLAYALLLTGYDRIASSKGFWAGWAGVAIALAIGGWTPASFAGAHALAEATYVTGLYTLSFVLLLDGFLRERRKYASRQLFFVSIAVGFAALSRVGAFSWISFGILGSRAVWLGGLALAGSLLLLILLVEWVRHPGNRRRILSVLAGLGPPLVAFYVTWGLVSSFANYLVLGTYFYTYRWVFFALIVGYGVLRFQLFDFELRARQAGAFLAAVVFALVAAVGTGSSAMDAGMGVLASRAVGLIAGALVGLGGYGVFRAVILRRGEAEEDPVRYHERRMEIYEATLESAFLKAQWSPEDRHFVETMREVFEITPDEHERIAARVRRRGAPPDSST